MPSPLKPDLQKFVVAWYCDDEPQCGIDCIAARDEETAVRIVERLRPYVRHAEAWYASGLLDDLRNFERDDANGNYWKQELPSTKVH